MGSTTLAPQLQKSQSSALDNRKPPVSVTSSPSTESSDREESQRSHEFHMLARDRFRESVTAETNRRAAMLEDQKFKCGDQWDPLVLAIRKAQERPCQTVNRIPGFVSHVVNNMRQARPEIKIDPVADGADEEIAEVRQGLIRYIEANSRAEIAYDTSFENMATMGLGYMRVVDAWAEPTSFDKDLRIEWLPNIFSVYEDPAATKPQWEDGKYRFIVEDISLPEFKRRFGSKTPASLEEFRSIGDSAPFWFINGKVRIAEYFHIEESEEVLYQLEDGTTEWESDLSEEQLALVKILEDGTPNSEWYSKRMRERVVWTLMYGLGTLRERVWKGRYIPVIPVIGSQTELEGERIISGMVRYAKESQRMFNYMYSCFIEVCALAPKAPFVAEFSQIEEFLPAWKVAHTSPQSYLPFKAKSVDGQLIPPPRRDQAEPPIAAYVQGLKLADENLKSVFRIFDASLGQRGPQESGIAIDARKVESDLATYDWIDNFNRALQFLGIVLNDLLEHYYNSPGRIVQILQEDLQQRTVVMNQVFQDDGSDKIYDLAKGRFAVRVSTGPSFATRRQEAAKSMLEMAKIFPQQMAAALPMMVREQDWSGKEALAAQLEKQLPPELRSKDPNAPAENPEQLKQMLQQAMGQIDVLSKALNEATDKRSAETDKELWNTLRNQMNAEVTLAVAEMKTASSDTQTLVQHLFGELKEIRAIAEQKLLSEQQPAAGSTQAPAPPQVPPNQGSTPAGVGTGNQTA